MNGLDLSLHCCTVFVPETGSKNIEYTTDNTKSAILSFCLQISFDGGLGLCLFFICENNRKSNKITHCTGFFLRSSFEDVGFFTIYR